MPKATFVADFSSFLTAIDKADIKMADFARGAEKVGPALNRMVDQFSGRKLIQEASLMVIAIEKAGGVAQLTGQELERAGNKASEAAEKLKKLGYDVPPGLQKLADAAAQSDSALAGLGKSVLTTAAGFVTAQAIWSAVTGVVKGLANELVTLTLHGAEAADVSENFTRLTAQAGHLGEALLGTLRAGTHATITDFELMKTVNQDLAAGMNLTDKQFGILSKGAFALAQATGGDVKTALDTMNDAMLTGRTRALALLTGKIDLTAAEEKFAASLGSTRDHLSDEGKLEAARAAILAAVGDATARLGDQTDGLDEIVAQANVSWKNLEETLGSAIATSDVLMTGLQGLKEALIQSFGGSQEALIKAIVDQINQAAIALVGLAQTGVESAGFMIKEFYAVHKVVGDLAQLVDLAALGFKGLSKVAAAATLDSAGVSRIEADLAMINARITERGKALQAMDTAQANVDTHTARFNKTLADLQAKMEAARATSAAFVGPLQAITVATDAAGAATGRHGDFLRQTEADTRRATKATEDALKAQERFRDSVHSLTTDAVNARKGFGMIGQLMQELTGDTAGWREEIELLSSRGLPIIVEKLQKVGHEARVDSEEFDKMRVAAKTLGDSLMDVFSHIPQTLANAFTGGGGFAGALKSIASQIGSTIGESIGKGVAALGKLGGPIGAAIGSLAGPLISLFGKLFDDPEKKINPIREAFVQAFRKVDASGVTEGLDALNKKAQEAGVTLDHLLNARNTEQYQAAIDELNVAFAKHAAIVEDIDNKIQGLTTAFVDLAPSARDALQPMIEDLLTMQGLTDAEREALEKLTGDVAPDFEKLEKLAADFGISLDALGPTFQQAHIEKTAAGIFDAFDRLTKAGADVGGVLSGMSDEISALVNDARKFGSAIPENMRPLIEELIRAGKLTDEAGNKITDLAGITFEETPVDPLVQAIQDLRDAILGLPGAAQTASDGIRDTLGRTHIPPVHIPFEWDIPDMPNPGALPPGLSSGGVVMDSGIGGRLLPFKPRGTDTVPAMLTPGELVLNKSQQAALLGGDQPITVVSHITVQMDGQVAGQNVVTQIARGKRGLDTQLKKALGMKK